MTQGIKCWRLQKVYGHKCCLLIYFKDIVSGKDDRCFSTYLRAVLFRTSAKHMSRDIFYGYLFQQRRSWYAFEFSFSLFIPIKRGLSLAWSGGSLRGSNAKSRGYHQLIVMKLCTSHNSHKACLAQNLSLVAFLIFGDMTSQYFPLKKGMCHRIRLFTPIKWV